jgi:K+-transporting ATPase c subunit
MVAQESRQEPRLHELHELRALRYPISANQAGWGMAIKVGDNVQLQSGGAEMTVTHCQYNERNQVACSSVTRTENPLTKAEVCVDWVTTSGTHHSACFPLAALKPTR